MLCPICSKELVVTGQARLETIEEHVCAPNEEICLKDKYECINEACSAYNRIMWGEDGDLYWKNGWSRKEYFNFIDGNEAAIGSFSRKANVEIYKKDENFLLCTLFGNKIYVKYLYKSNEDGDILSRKWKFEIIKKNGSYYISGFRMLMYSIRKFHKNLVEKTIDEEKFEKEYLILNEWQKKDWWRRLSCWWARTYCLIVGI